MKTHFRVHCNGKKNGEGSVADELCDHMTSIVPFMLNLRTLAWWDLARKQEDCPH